MIKSTEQVGQLLIKMGAIDEEDLSTALKLQQKNRARLGETLLEMGVIKPAQLLEALSTRLGVKGCILRHGLIDPAIAKMIDRDEARQMKVLPLFKVGDRLTVAMVEPQRLPLIDRLVTMTGCEINPVLALESNLAEFAERYLAEEVSVDSFLVSLSEQDVEFVEREGADSDAVTDLDRMDGTPAVNLVNLSILSAIRDDASDIHIEPDQKQIRVRYRIDGVLRELLTAPLQIHAAVISRIKVIAKMDIAEKRLPQEGRVRTIAEGREVDLRVSTMPTILGEKAVIRVLDKASLSVERTTRLT